jgi:O-antigen ligase
MWRTDTYWFDVAMATTVLMLGHLYFGRFEEHRPRWRRLLKSVLVVAIIVGITAWAGRTWTFAFLGVSAVGVLIIHGWWLPRQGVNGWTAEPRDRYYALIGLDPTGKRRDRAVDR